MKRNQSLLFRALAVVLVLCCMASCKKNDIKKIQIDNQFAVALFNDTVKIGDLLEGLDPTVSQFIKVNDNGNIYAYYADSVKDAVVAQDILGKLEDVNFESSNEFELPTIPPSPVPVPLELPMEDLFSIPFEYEGYEINSVVIKTGKIILDISTNFTIIEKLSLTTDEIVLSDGTSFDVTLEPQNGSQSIEIDLSNAMIAPKEEGITFSAMLYATISDEGIGGMYNFDMIGSITDLEFKSIDGAIAESRFEFEGTHDFSLNFPNLFGDLKITTPEFAIKYINSFGFTAQGFIDSLYLTEGNGTMTSLVRDWNEVEILLHSTDGVYDSITDLDDQLVDEIDLLKTYQSITFSGDIIMGCDEVSGNMITDESHIDIIADLALPLEFNIDNLAFIDTLDFNLNLGSEENTDSEGIHVEDIFDELEFKFVFENHLPIEIKPQLYMVSNGEIIDHLFEDDAVIHGNFDGIVTEDVIEVHVVDEKLQNIQIADQLIIHINLSSHGEDVVINTNDYFNLRIGLKTKTTEIYTEDLNY